MDEHERLRAARKARYASAAKAAAAMGVPAATYTHHENGTRPLKEHALRYARFFRVNLEWLLTGRGEMKGRLQDIPVTGLVGAGASVEMIGDTAGVDPPMTIALPEAGRIAALKVRGESQWPRFLDGEYVLFDPEPVLPQTLVNRYAVVQTLDGRRLIKMLRRGRGDGRWRLESHNAPPEDDVQLLGAWRYLGTLEP